MSHRHRFAASTAAVAIAFSAPSVAMAQEQTYAFDIPAQDLGSALRAFAKATRQQISFNGEMVRGKRSNTLKGSYGSSAGLGILLRDTGFTTRRVERGVLILTPVAGGSELQPRGKGQAGSAAADNGDAVSADPVHQEIVVTGSHIRGSAPAGANLIVMRRDDLDKTGRGTLAEALQTLPQVHGGGANDATLRTGIGAAPNGYGFGGVNYGATSLNLRGLGVEETLTLVNGRRLAPAGSNSAIADISALPMAAVERVEILADGASATYGADAMAGVVNIIMNRRFAGAETRLRSGIETRSGEPEFQASQTFGWAFDRGNVLISADYASREGITAKGRPYAATADLRSFGGGDHRRSYCSPGNILFPEEFAGAIPAGQDGTALTPDQILPNENRCDLFSDRSYLAPKSRKGGIYIAGSYDIADNLRLSGDVIASRRSTTNVGSFYPFDFEVPTSNAFRQQNGLGGDESPFNQPIFLTYLFTEAGPLISTVEANTLLASAGADYNFGDTWQLSFIGGYGRYDSKSSFRNLDTRPASEGGALQQALASSDPATAFNPFGDGSANSRALVDGFLYRSRDLQGSSYHAASFGLSGSLAELTGGSMKIALGGDYRREKFSNRELHYYANLGGSYVDTSPIAADRDVAAVYAELFVPLFSDANALPGVRRLNLSLSSRYDSYSDFGDTFNPKAGLTWVPTNGLTFRGSYGTSFKAPLLTSLYRQSTAVFASLPALPGSPDVDGNGLVRTMSIFGGNPDLGPEKGKSWTVGAVIEPVALPKLRLHATYFNLRFTGRFAQVTRLFSVFADPEAYEGIAYFPRPTQSHVDRLIASVDEVDGIVPGPGSVEAIIDSRTFNFSSQVLDGVDAGASYSWKSLGGTVNVSAELSYLSRYQSRLGESATETSYRNNVGLPVSWKGRVGGGWTGGRLSLSGWINHVGSYMNKLVTPHEPINSYTTVDLLLDGKLDSSTSLQFFVTNIFDRAPPFVNDPSGIGYDGANASPFGRQVAVQLIKRW